jgi:hypothetical protein
MFTAAVFTITKGGNNPRTGVGHRSRFLKCGGMDNGILFSLKNEVLITLPHWVNFKNNRLSLMRQTQRIKYCMNPLTRNI